MSSPTPHHFTVRSPADLLALVPYLVGYHPIHRLVAVGVHHAKPVFVASGDLPEPGTPPQQIRALLDHVAHLLARQHATAVIVIGYGSAEQIDPVMAGIQDVFATHQIQLHDALRVTDNRYVSYLCDNPDCCPPDGVPFDPTSSVLATRATVAGLVAWPDRAALAALVAPVSGAARTAMRLATERTQAQLTGLVADADDHGSAGRQPHLDREAELANLGARLRQAGHHAVQQAFDRYEHGATLNDDQVARLTLLLAHLPVRDDAWQRTDGRDEHIALWTDLTRRARPDLVPAPASLLAFAAWRSGNGALANVALDRALAADASYRLALLLADLLAQGVPPSALDGWPAVPGDASTDRPGART
jgi:hypothetical protein